MPCGHLATVASSTDAVPVVECANHARLGVVGGKPVQFLGALAVAADRLFGNAVFLGEQFGGVQSGHFVHFVFCGVVIPRWCSLSFFFAVVKPSPDVGKLVGLEVASGWAVARPE